MGEEVGQGLDELTFEQRRDLLELVVEEVTIDGDNNATITLAIPFEHELTPPESVAIASGVSKITQCLSLC